MLKQRILVVLAILPVGLLFIALGGWWYAVFIAAVLTVAAFELIQIFKHDGYAPSRLVLLPGVCAITLGKFIFGMQTAIAIFTLFVLAAMLYHVIAYERGIKTAATDFMITSGSLVYLGWIGSYLISLRFIENGMWWLSLMIFIIALGDSGAYFIGRAFGRHKLAPLVSPKKTWEGYIGGVFIATLSGVGLAALFHRFAPEMTLLAGAVSGVLLGALAPLGDLGESLIKRQFGVKDSGRLFPGHGGMFDRIDSWLWAAVLGYYLVLWLW